MKHSLRAFFDRRMNAFHAWRAARTRPATGFVYQPEPRSIGSFARGRQMLAGNFLFAGHLVESDQEVIWDIKAPAPEFSEELHGFAWLDDIVAVGDVNARKLAQTSIATWMARFGAGAGPGWTPDLTGRRLIRWINHALFFLSGQDEAVMTLYYRTLAQQAIFLSRRWAVASRGLPRFEALAGLTYAGLSLKGMEAHLKPTLAALGAECDAQIDEGGGLVTRNPEELLEVFALLTWTEAIVEASEFSVPKALSDAVARIAPTLRALRHADGDLARFHGGGRGVDGRLDIALSDSKDMTQPSRGLHMGYMRLSAGRTSVIMDASAPDGGSQNAHASTLAFELTSGHRPLIVNCGSGARFGAEWRRAARRTPSHSTLCIDGQSSSQFSSSARTANELLVRTPKSVKHELRSSDDTDGIIVAHDGYQPEFGLTHIRQLNLSLDGRSLMGEDTLATIEHSDERIYDAAIDKRQLQGVPYTLRFHIHPDVDATLDMGGKAVSMELKSGEIWVFRFSGKAQMSLEESVYLEYGRLKPRATKQILLSAAALDYATRLSWSLSKAQDTPTTLRDESFIATDY